MNGGGLVNGGVDKRRGELKGHMVNLNKSFLSWVEAQVTTDKPKLLSNGLRDYLDHAGSLEKEYEDVITAAPVTSPSVPQFSFGHKFPTPAASPPPAAAAAKPKVAKKEEASGDDENTVFESKSKVFRRVEGDWKDMGIGNLSVVKPESGKAFVCFRNISTGKIFLRAGLYKDMKITVQKKQATIVLFPAKEKEPPMPDQAGSPAPVSKEEDSEGKPVTFSFRFGKVETVMKFKEACENNAS
ncbi:hypothetical protein HOP50_04g27990 [Chloropicon primus]|uniref:RanBD1 domain-containing protein n=1 Tax=Chloropicon primus TaxID=1764295 RepID=A0A5B8MJ33_9CHLO|nr:hypothetical protein A3770_04p27990 [Chloropicon primus]UPQ99491.1 hypothetical protein HOP50_04g27990 [Chloropicon primus]|eukprot:QDZ20281.1 hypothetical protein A3770_04p27990 [Chloropicon primus]